MTGPSPQQSGHCAFINCQDLRHGWNGAHPQARVATRTQTSRPEVSVPCPEHKRGPREGPRGMPAGPRGCTRSLLSGSLKPEAGAAALQGAGPSGLVRPRLHHESEKPHCSFQSRYGHKAWVSVSWSADRNSSELLVPDRWRPPRAGDQRPSFHWVWPSPFCWVGISAPILRNPLLLSSSGKTCNATIGLNETRRC